MNVVASLPRIVRFHGISRSGPGEAECPHCGAQGSVVHHFECEDGTRRGAMSGCVQLFPVSPLAREDMRLQKKADAHARGKGNALNRWDLAIRAALDAFYAGTTTADFVTRVIQCERSKASNWRRSRYGGR